MKLLEFLKDSILYMCKSNWTNIATTGRAPRSFLLLSSFTFDSYSRVGFAYMAPSFLIA